MTVSLQCRDANDALLKSLITFARNISKNRNVWRFSVGNWQIEVGREIDMETETKTEMKTKTKKRNEVFLRLGYLDGAKETVGVGEAKRGRGVDCVGVIEGRRQSIEDAKKIEVNHMVLVFFPCG